MSDPVAARARPPGHRGTAAPRRHDGCRPAGLAGDVRSVAVTVPAPDVEDAIRALAHPGRRAMLRLVWDRERPASELAEAAGLSRSAASQHLKLLREVGLVHVRVDATRRLYRADLERVAEVAALLDDFWATPLGLRRSAVALSRATTRRGTGP